MADQSIACPSCGKKIPLTRALRAEIEAALKQQFDERPQNRERELRAKYESRLEEACGARRRMLPRGRRRESRRNSLD